MRQSIHAWVFTVFFNAFSLSFHSIYLSLPVSFCFLYSFPFDRVSLLVIFLEVFANKRSRYLQYPVQRRKIHIRLSIHACYVPFCLFVLIVFVCVNGMTAAIRVPPTLEYQFQPIDWNDCCRPLLTFFYCIFSFPITVMVCMAWACFVLSVNHTIGFVCASLYLTPLRGVQYSLFSHSFCISMSVWDRM